MAGVRVPGSEFQYVEGAVDVVCCRCGVEYRISTRHNRRGTFVCTSCRAPARKLLVTDKDRRFWLQRFSDREILEMAIGIFCDQLAVDGNLELIRAYRKQLLEEEGAQLPEDRQGRLRKSPAGAACA